MSYSPLFIKVLVQDGIPTLWLTYDAYSWDYIALVNESPLQMSLIRLSPRASTLKRHLSHLSCLAPFRAHLPIWVHHTRGPGPTLGNINLLLPAYEPFATCGVKEEVLCGESRNAAGANSQRREIRIRVLLQRPTSWVKKWISRGAWDIVKRSVLYSD